MIWSFHSKVFPQEGRKHGGGGLVAKSCPTLVTPWTVARQAPLSLGFSRQEGWSGLLFSSPGDLPNTGIKPRSPALQAVSLPTELQGKPGGQGIDEERVTWSPGAPRGPRGLLTLWRMHCFTFLTSPTPDSEF